MNVNKVVIIDGYNDEPAGLGVPPYLDIYARYTAGAIWSFDSSIKILYFTIDEVRRDFEFIIKKINSAQLLIVLGGTIVPGKYLGGEPIKPEEVLKIGRLASKPIKILGGPMAKFGFGIEGGRRPIIMKEIKDYYDIIVKGDVEIIVSRLLEEKLRVESIDPYEKRENAHSIRDFAIKGAKIVLDHPNYGLNLICEIETYRGCPRVITGGCSFCAEVLHGLPDFRPIEDIVKEIEILYQFGVRHFRLGRQPDIFSYMAEGVGEKEFPKLNPYALEKLFSSIRNVAPNLKVLHIDNANPGAIANHPDEAREIAKIIVKYHTPGDVAAFGVESADPVVIKMNNLKAMPEESLRAIEIINEIGAKRGYNGLPELLPGINFVYGLIGETKKTYELNLEFMREVLRRKLLVRRINIRQCIPLPGTRMWTIGNKIIRKHKEIFKAYKEKMRKEIDLPMLKRVIPPWTILRNVFTEKHQKYATLARQVGSYPILVYIPEKVSLNKYIDVVVVDHGYRSITALPIPLNINRISIDLLMRIPGIGKKRAAKIISKRPFRSVNELRKVLGNEEIVEKLLSIIRLNIER
ncbi:MAG: radical SAM protein [Candidatus Methanomethylicota archaeon]|uniref:Radical SAM protein n=1 Tax=Thermoproteota archaeon TaxID=2056631 RepID=A0A497ESQ5_9CREN|nr:MAG: radical SAM protein [Candidatus Verstraetearchaeota archaeon]